MQLRETLIPGAWLNGLVKDEGKCIWGKINMTDTMNYKSAASDLERSRWVLASRSSVCCPAPEPSLQLRADTSRPRRTAPRGKGANPLRCRTETLHTVLWPEGQKRWKQIHACRFIRISHQLPSSAATV